ncbi:MAG: ABC transporter ATP-binding protein [Planctomycetota bacterium]
MLQLKNVEKTFRGPAESVCALGGVDLTVERGDFIAIEGPSGCGKSTLLLTLGGLLAPDAGQVLSDDDDVYRKSAEQRSTWRAANVGFVFQQFHLVPYLSVIENILAPSLAPVATEGRELKDRAEALLEKFGLADRKLHVPSELSTGEKQRTALARALLHRPRVLLADEPTGNLDRENAELVLQHLSNFADAESADAGAVVLVTHDPHAASFAKSHVRLEGGVRVDRRDAASTRES